MAPPDPSSIVNEESQPGSAAVTQAKCDNKNNIYEYERMDAADEAIRKVPSMFDSQGNIKESIKAKLSSSTGPLAFDVRYPTMERLGVFDGILPKNAYIPERRSPILFDGYFIEPSSSSSSSSLSSSANNNAKEGMNNTRTVTESNVTIYFSLDEMQFDNPTRYDIDGSGSNEYGRFEINGSYYIPRRGVGVNGGGGGDNSGSVNNNHNQSSPTTVAMASVWCTKTYNFNNLGGGETSGGRKRGTKKIKQRYDDDDNDSDDDDFLEEKADYAEVGELYEDATMSIEDLRRKYYGTGGGGGGTSANNGLKDDDEYDDDDDDGGGKLPAVKKPRPSPPGPKDDSDDDECGF